ncbi:hypothetical protein D1BOALGB6SA_10751 [Olavius sp. associated proteobacterium Delta 1]|nr:hypothetical protein D1BOALGB6SA_10751 [Olavius sp. associated proteobacterium Delta 1]
MAAVQNSKINVDESRLPTLLIIPLIQLLVGVFLIIALLNDHRELTVLILIVLAILIGTKIWSRLSPAKIHHETMLDKQRGFPGETFIFSARIRNAKILPVLAQLAVSFSKGFQPVDSPAALKKNCSLLWYQEVNFKCRLNALRRGVYRLGAAQLRVGDLFGFYSSKADTAAALDIIIYPRLIPLKPVALPRRDLFGIPGSQSPIEDPVYVYGTREYQSGRPARYIHWKASARLAQLQEKICEPASQEKILLIVAVDHFSENQAQAEFEKILEVAASAAVFFDRSGFAVGLVTNGALKGGGSPVWQIGRGVRQIPSILETLARLQMTPSADLGAILKRGLNLPWGTTGVSLSYDSAESCNEISAFFNHRRAPIVSVVCRLSPPPAPDQKLQPGVVLALEDICGEEPAIYSDCSAIHSD